MSNETFSEGAGCLMLERDKEETVERSEGTSAESRAGNKGRRDAIQVVRWLLMWRCVEVGLIQVIGVSKENAEVRAL